MAIFNAMLQQTFAESVVAKIIHVNAMVIGYIVVEPHLQVGLAIKQRISSELFDLQRS